MLSAIITRYALPPTQISTQEPYVADLRYDSIKTTTSRSSLQKLFIFLLVAGELALYAWGVNKLYVCNKTWGKVLGAALGLGVLVTAYFARRGDDIFNLRSKTTEQVTMVRPNYYSILPAATTTTTSHAPTAVPTPAATPAASTSRETPQHSGGATSAPSTAAAEEPEPVIVEQHGSWQKVLHTSDGRSNYYYYNVETDESFWDPPRGWPHRGPTQSGPPADAGDSV